jgi:ADP-heptose:LPS heptosyltransferase
MNPREVRTILVVKLRTLGDVLTTFPLLRALKELYPRARLIMAADTAYRDLFTTHPRVDEFWGHPAKELAARGAWFAWQQHWAFVRQMRRARVDLYVDLYGSLRTALWGWLAGVPMRLGFALRGRKYFYTRTITAAHRYVVDLNLQFARALGWEGTDNRLEFFLSQGDQEAAQRHLLAQGWRPGQSLLAVSPGGGWPLKCWAPERFGVVAGRLAQETGCRVVVTGSAAEQGLVEACARAVGKPTLSAVGLSLRTLAAVIAQARLFLGNDSGPKYFAEAFGVPTLICYGPTDPVNNNPDSPRTAVAFHPVECRPCHSETCRRGERVCLDRLEPATVLELARGLWRLSA